MRAAVHHHVYAVRQSARDRDGDGRIVFIRIQIRRRSRRRQARKENQFGRHAPVERQFDDALLVNHLAYAVAARFDQRGVRHLHLVRHRADFERRNDRQ